MSQVGFSDQLFADKTVVITGAGGGIGLAVARAFKACNANIIAHSGRAGTAERLAGIADFVLEADFTLHDDINSFVTSVATATGHIDVLVNNAGTMFGRFPADTLENTNYEKLVMLNQTSVVMITRAFIPLLRNSESAAIINTVSISAKTGGSPGSSIYSATKAFVATYTKALARELAPDNIRANAVSPGTIMTDFHNRYSSEEKLEATRQAIPLQRLGRPEDCAPAYLFLAADSLSGYITGQTLEINGGQLII
jgi:3-oxoacyl-[acyl-carrier protein] reductase